MSPETLDTLAMARKERDKQGSFEIAISYEGEVGLQSGVRACNKNPGHRDFVPVDEFNMCLLPSGYKDDDIVKLVKAMSDLTVRVSVKYVSDKRPETFPGTSKPYPYYNNRGSKILGVGTGVVYQVNIRSINNFQNFPRHCECKDCRNSHTPETVCAAIFIMTAKHVVFDEDEGAHTTCHLFFDRGNTPESCSGVVTLSLGTIIRISVKDDWCVIMFWTHDLEMARRLQKLKNDSKILQAKLIEKYECTPLDDQTNTLEADRGRSLHHTDYTHLVDPERLLAIIVSHPHGCSKQVSVGYCLNDKDRKYRAIGRFVYTTATCPGSSGAFVFIMKRTNFPLYHCGNMNEKEWNYGERTLLYQLSD